MGQHNNNTIYDRCWVLREGNREPYRLTKPETEPCCFCGADTQSGIYTRARPEGGCIARPPATEEG
jgi:hypothetical protein